MMRMTNHLRWNSPAFLAAWVAIAAVCGLALARLTMLNAFLLVLFGLLGVGTLIEPLIGLLSALFLGILWAWLRVELPAVPSLIAMPFVALTLGAWLMRGAARRQIRFHTPATMLLLILFIGAAVLSLSDAVELPAYGLPELIKWLQILALLWLVVDYVDARLLPWLVIGLLLIGAFQAALGVWQFGLRGSGPDHFAISGDRFYRAYGTFEQPNPFAGYLGLVFPLGAGVLANWCLGYRYRAASHRFTGLQLLAFLGFVFVVGLMGVALVASWSRGGWLAMTAAILGMCAALPRRAWLGVVLVALVVVGTLGLDVLGLVPSSVSARLTDFTQYTHFDDVRGVGINDANYAVLERLAHWQAAVQMWRANYWTGVGFGDYEPAYPEYRLVNWPIALGHAHNYFLNVAAETGTVGLIAFLVLWIGVLWQTWRATRRLPARHWLRGLAIGLLGSWIHLSVHSVFDNLYVNNVHLHVGVMLGLVALLASWSKTENHPNSTRDPSVRGGIPLIR